MQSVQCLHRYSLQKDNIVDLFYNLSKSCSCELDFQFWPTNIFLQAKYIISNNFEGEEQSDTLSMGLHSPKSMLNQWFSLYFPSKSMIFHWFLCQNLSVRSRHRYRGAGAPLKVRLPNNVGFYQKCWPRIPCQGAFFQANAHLTKTEIDVNPFVENSFRRYFCQATVS